MPPAQDTPLQLVTRQQGIWSKTADRLKNHYGRARLWTFAFTILGALLAMVASQLPGGQARLYLAGASTVLFAMVSFVTARYLGQERAVAWVRARAASEALKRAAYKYLSKAAPYDEADRDDKLVAEFEKIEADVDDMRVYAVESGASRIPAADLSSEEYISARAKGQSDFYQKRAREAQDKARLFRRAEAILAAVTALITAIVGIAGKDPLGWGFDFVAIASVLTTISATVLAHIEAERYDFTVTQYRAAELRLQSVMVKAKPPYPQPSPQWSQLVEACEAIFQEENNSWISKWSKPRGK